MAPRQQHTEPVCAAFGSFMCWCVCSARFPRGRPSCDSWRWERWHRGSACVCSRGAFWEGFAASGRTEGRFSPFIKLTCLSLRSSAACWRSQEGVCGSVGTSKTVLVLVQRMTSSRAVCAPGQNQVLSVSLSSSPLHWQFGSSEVRTWHWCSHLNLLQDVVLHSVVACQTVGDDEWSMNPTCHQCLWVRAEHRR